MNFKLEIEKRPFKFNFFIKKGTYCFCWFFNNTSFFVQFKLTSTCQPENLQYIFLVWGKSMKFSWKFGKLYGL